MFYFVFVFLLLISHLVISAFERLLALGLSPFQSVKLALRISLLHSVSVAPTNSDKLCFHFHLFKNILSFLLDFFSFYPRGI